MKPIADFFPRILPYVPGCSLPLAAQAVLDTAIQFCEASAAVRQTLDPVDTVPEQSVYDLDAPTQQQVVRVMRAWANGRELYLVASDEAPVDTLQLGTPTMLHTTRLYPKGELVLTPTPDAAYPLVLEVAVRPTREATLLADDLYNIWLEAIVAGAVSAIQRIPDQAFSNPGSAGERYAEFRSHISRARINAGLGQVVGSKRVKARPFA